MSSMPMSMTDPTISAQYNFTQVEYRWVNGKFPQLKKEKQYRQSSRAGKKLLPRKIVFSGV